MSEQAAATPERRFLVTVRKPWKLWIWPAIALFYFLWVLLVVLVPIRTGVPESIWVLAGLGLFGLILLIQLLLLPTRKVRVKKAKAAKRAKAQAAEAVPVESLDDMNALESEAPAAAAPAGAPVVRGVPIEYRLTNEDYKAHRVLEMSLPPKSQHRGAVYAKAYVAINDQYVLRVEDLVAERHETG